MDLQLHKQHFIIGGAGRGLGRATAIQLLREGAHILGISRSAEGLNSLAEAFPGQVSVLPLDLTDIGQHDKMVNWASQHRLSGIFVNAGGPVATSFSETTMEQWDEGYNLVLRWKFALVKTLLPFFRNNAYGRILFSESVSVKQPIPNLVLSNTYRMAVVGMAKTLAAEVAKENITVNVLAPGYHNTDAMKRLITKKSETENISRDTALKRYAEQTLMGKLGNPADFASLAAWLLSPLSEYITGQLFMVDGGLVTSV